MSFFLQDNPDPSCAKGGRAAYGQGVRYVTDPRTKLSNVSSSSFLAYHTILKTSYDYYESMRQARIISANLTSMLNTNLKSWGYETEVEVFPYSVFYVFYEQYLTMWPDTLFSIGVSMFAIFVVTFFLMGLDIFSSIVVVMTIAMIIIDIGGLMYWWNITLNAVSLVNLVMVRSSVFFYYKFREENSWFLISGCGHCSRILQSLGALFFGFRAAHQNRKSLRCTGKYGQLDFQWYYSHKVRRHHSPRFCKESNFSGR